MAKFTFELPEDVVAEAAATLAAERVAEAEVKVQAAVLAESFSGDGEGFLGGEEELIDHVRFSKRYAPWERDAAAKRVRELRRLGSAERPPEQVEADRATVSILKHGVSLGLREASRRHTLGDELGISLGATSGERDLLDVADASVAAEVANDLARTELQNFKESQQAAAQKFQAEKLERSVSQASQKLGVLFVHALPVPDGQGRFTEALNHAASADNPFDRARIVIGLRPAIAVSTVPVAEARGETMYPFGLVLGEGRVLAAYPGDAATFADEGGRRRSRSDPSLGGSTVQPQIGERLREATDASGYNEIVVEEPLVSGIFIDLDRREISSLLAEAGTGAENPDLEKFKKYACEKIGIPPVPVFARRGGKIEKTESGDDLPSLKPTAEARQKLLEKIVGIDRFV